MFSVRIAKRRNRNFSSSLFRLSGNTGKPPPPLLHGHTCTIWINGKHSKHDTHSIIILSTSSWKVKNPALSINVCNLERNSFSFKKVKMLKNSMYNITNFWKQNLKHWIDIYILGVYINKNEKKYRILCKPVSNGKALQFYTHFTGRVFNK